jgi:hypothetical protein
MVDRRDQAFIHGDVEANRLAGKLDADQSATIFFDLGIRRDFVRGSRNEFASARHLTKMKRESFFSILERFSLSFAG